MGALEIIALLQNPAVWAGAAAILAAGRGFFATVAEQVPNKYLGSAAPIVDALGGNNMNARGSQCRGSSWWDWR